METRNLKEGDRIAYNTSRNYYSTTFIHFDNVERVTKSGQVVLMNGMKFNNRGDQIKSVGNDFSRSYLVDAAAADQLFESEKERRRLNLIFDTLLEELKKRRGNKWSNLNKEEEEMVASLTKKLQEK